jgi:DNA uptake protein ComE-like DNA-binding protein
MISNWKPSPKELRWLAGGLIAGSIIGLAIGVAVSGIKPASVENSFEKSKIAAQSLGQSYLETVYNSSRAFNLKNNPALYQNILTSIEKRYALYKKSESPAAKLEKPKTVETAFVPKSITTSSLVPAPKDNPPVDQIGETAYLDGAGPTDINTATVKQIDDVPRMSTDTAKDIWNYIQTKGPIKSFDELDQIKNVGPKTIEKLRSLFHIKK